MEAAYRLCEIDLVLRSRTFESLNLYPPWSRRQYVPMKEIESRGTSALQPRQQLALQRYAQRPTMERIELPSAPGIQRTFDDLSIREFTAWFEQTKEASGM